MASDVVERVRGAYEAFARGDLEGVLAVMSPDVEWDASDALAHRGVWHGHGGVKEYIATLGDTWEEFELAADELTESADGRHVMVLGRVRGRLRGRPDPVDARFAHVLELDGDKVARLKVCLDRAAALHSVEAARAAS